MSKNVSSMEAAYNAAVDGDEAFDVVSLTECLVDVDGGFGEQCERLLSTVDQIRSNDNDSKVLNAISRFGLMMAERGYARAMIDFGKSNVEKF